MLRIYDFIPEHQPELAHLPPIGVDYQTGLSTRLHPTRTIVKGELIEVIYRDPDTDAPVVRETRSYTRNALGLVVSRDMTIEWYHYDGTLSDQTKSYPKRYDANEAADEIKRRRANMADTALATAVDLLGASVANSLPSFTALGQHRSSWVETGDRTIVSVIQSWDFEGWTAEICEAVISEFDYDME